MITATTLRVNGRDAWKVDDGGRKIGDQRESSLLGPPRTAARCTRLQEDRGRIPEPRFGERASTQSCLLNNQIAGTRNTTPKAAMTAMLVSTGCSVISWRMAAGTLSLSATNRKGSMP